MVDKSKIIKVREYGSGGPCVILLHGGPGAPGYMKPVAERLAKQFHVIEPFQRGSGEQPLTVAQHIQDLHDVINAYCGSEKPLLVGHSWGAMLALAFAAEYPNVINAIVLIGCGTFDMQSRKQMEDIRNERIDTQIRQRMERLTEKYPDPNVRLAVLGGLYQQIDSVDLIEVKNDLHSCDAAAHEQTWADMLDLQARGVYPKAFDIIDCPVIMLHGDQDPHPGTIIRDSLKAFLGQLEYISWPRCGHYPWLEKAAADFFYTTLTDWLLMQSNKEATNDDKKY